MGLLRKRGTGETEKFRESVGREPKLLVYIILLIYIVGLVYIIGLL